jgi:glycosyltransferase involved in cell wall biosynthesis
MDIFVHHLNDMSGSPRIISEKIRQYRSIGRQVALVTNTPDGLIDCSDLEVFYVPYRKRNSRLLMLFGLIGFWWKASRVIKKNFEEQNSTIHASTLINAPVLLLTKRKFRKVVHVMEYKLKPWIFLIFLQLCVLLSKGRVIFLSNFLKDKSPLLRLLKNHITYPCIDQEFYFLDIGSLTGRMKARFSDRVVTLVCSQIWFKGYDQFILLASKMPDCTFLLILNGSELQFQDEYPSNNLPSNLSVKFNHKDMSAVMASSTVLLSLTDRRGWVETFALTLAEAMASGCPVIAPNVGAQSEYIRHGENGFLVNERDLLNVQKLIRRMLDDELFYCQLGKSAFNTAKSFELQNYRLAVKTEIQFFERAA